MSRKLYVDVTVRMIVIADAGTDVSELISEMDYRFQSNTDGLDILSTEVTDFEVTDSK